MKEHIDPFYEHNDATAMRSFQLAAAQEGHMFNSNSEDYTLWYCGDFDTDQGIHIPMDTPNLLMRAIDLKE